jgi:hypothetical protein
VRAAKKLGGLLVRTALTACGCAGQLFFAGGARPLGQLGGRVGVLSGLMYTCAAPILANPSQTHGAVAQRASPGLCSCSRSFPRACSAADRDRDVRR